MTQADRESVLIIFRAAAKDPKRARHIMGREDITAEQAEAIMDKVAYIFETVANTNPDITMRDAIDRAVWCTQNEVQRETLRNLLQKQGISIPNYQNSRG